MFQLCRARKVASYIILKQLKLQTFPVLLASPWAEDKQKRLLECGFPVTLNERKQAAVPPICCKTFFSTEYSVIVPFIFELNALA